MEKDLIIDVNQQETVIALLEDHRLVELNKEANTDRAFSLRDVYLGKVKKLIPTLNAAFVDIGDKKDAFVHYLDLGLNFKAFDYFVKQMNPNRDFKQFFSSVDVNNILEKEGKIENVLTPGQPIIVQIVKEPISTKGSRLTGEISIAGRNIVLLPFGDKISVSQKISSKEEKKRLERLIYSILPPNYGVIIRTAAEGKNAAVLDAELKLLVKKWEDSWSKMAYKNVPELLFTENSKTTTILRDLLNDSFSNIYVNDETVYQEIKEYISTILPEYEKIVKLYKGHEPILDHFEVTKQIKSAFGKVVPIRQGAYLVIEHTEALHVVDVNSGTRVKTGKDQEQNAFDVNCHAAQEIASDYPGQFGSYTTGAGDNNLYETVQTMNYLAANVFATYDNTFKKNHNLKVMAGFNWEQYNRKNLEATGYDLITDELSDFNLITTTRQPVLGGGQTVYALAGFFGPQIMANTVAATGTYQKAFLIAACISVVGVVFTFIYRALNKNK